MRLFAYGTLLDPDIQISVTGHTLEGREDRLYGYRKVTRQFHSGIFPDITEDTKSAVNGKVFDLADADLNKCDLYEGDEYVRIKVTLDSGTTAFVYRSR